jgi:hypothetical protein
MSHEVPTCRPTVRIPPTEPLARVLPPRSLRQTHARMLAGEVVPAFSICISEIRKAYLVTLTSVRQNFLDSEDSLGFEDLQLAVVGHVR